MRLHPVDALLYIALKIARVFDRRDLSLSTNNLSNIRTLLVISSTAIGDTLLSTPAISALRAQYPSARIIALLNQQNKDLFLNNPDIDSIIPYYKGYRRFIHTALALRAEKIDAVAILHGNEPQATPLAYLSGARCIVKLPNNNPFRFLLSNQIPILAWSDFSHAFQQRLAVAKLLGADAANERMICPLSPDGEVATTQFLEANGINGTIHLVGFQVAASTVSRMWPADRFIQLGRKLVEAFPNTLIIITGSLQEHDYCQEIANSIGSAAIVSAGKVPLKYLPSLVARFKVLVSGDTGIMHLGATVGTPLVALFAMADARKSGPAYDLDKHTIIQKWRTCTPCIGKKCRHPICMENISVQEVYEAIANKLEPTEA